MPAQPERSVGELDFALERFAAAQDALTDLAVIIFSLKSRGFDASYMEDRLEQQMNEFAQWRSFVDRMRTRAEEAAERDGACAG